MSRRKGCSISLLDSIFVCVCGIYADSCMIFFFFVPLLHDLMNRQCLLYIIFSNLSHLMG